MNHFPSAACVCVCACLHGIRISNIIVAVAVIGAAVACTMSRCAVTPPAFIIPHKNDSYQLRWGARTLASVANTHIRVLC